MNGLRLICPQCREPAEIDVACRCGFVLERRNGILRALPEDRARHFAKFLADYGTIRHAEGRGSSEAAYYEALPFRDLSGAHSDQWDIRAKTFRYFERRLLPKKPAAILDLGAGNGWLSHRLTRIGHNVVAVDIFTDSLDGLQAALKYGDFPLVEAEFDRLPFASAQFDLAIFNASLHYSTDYERTLAEVRRCLHPNGRIAVLDSPLYKAPEHGELMRSERRVQFQRQFGFPSDSLACREYLHEKQLDELAGTLRLRWRIHQPWYGLAWHLRPVRARVAGRRPPSRFCILEAEMLAQ